MTEQQMRNKKPRKILGNGNNVDFYNSSTNLNAHTINSSQHQQTQLQQASQLLNASSSCISNNNLTLSTSTTTITGINLQQQQQQMDRIHLANLMNQEMHALWPYGTATFLSPLMPTHNVSLPYALAGTLPYAAVPIYQTLPGNLNPLQNNVSQVSSSSASSSATTTASQQQQQQQQQNVLRSNASSSNNPPTNGSDSFAASSSSSNQNSPNDSNKINIQIGLQCVSQNAPLNFNSMNDSVAKVNLLNFCNPSQQMGDKNGKESNSSVTTSPILVSPNDNDTIVINTGAGGDATNTIASGSNNGTVTLSQAKFNELTRLALRGSEIAEKLAYTHRNRPCFKKIDSLCARMKQDLIRPDGVLPNINSQGIAWAVKDFIFVFTRVINAWIIIKGYVYNTPEGLNKVKAALSPDFAASFAAWQDTTMDFVENLIKSFVSLDQLVQSQRNVYQKSESDIKMTTPIKILQPGSPLLDDTFDFLNLGEKSQQNSLNKNYIYTMVEDSEDSQRQATVNGTYFKTGTYNPIKKDALLLEQSPTNTAAVVTSPTTSNATSLATNSTLVEYFNEQLSEFWPTSTVDLEPATCAAKASTNADYLKIQEKLSTNWQNYNLQVLEQNLSELSNDFNPNGPPRPLDKDLIEKLDTMIDGLMSMKSGDMFFKQQFTKNYFPEFIAKHKNDFMDLRTIILKCQTGGYQHIYEVVHDVKKIVYKAKEFSKINNDVKLQKSITDFDVEFKKFLSEPPFDNIQFEHITGEPKEVLYKSRK